jgi:hypothetical protein
MAYSGHVPDLRHNRLFWGDEYIVGQEIGGYLLSTPENQLTLFFAFLCCRFELSLACPNWSAANAIGCQ